VINWVHSYAAGLRAHSLPSVTPSLANLGEFVLLVPDLAHCCPTVDTNPTHLGTRETQSGKLTLLGHQLHTGTRTTSHLAAATRLKFDVVQSRPDRDVPKRESVARLDLTALSRLEDLANLDALWRQDVTLLPIVVVEQQDSATAIRVVLNRSNLGRYPIFISAKIDDSVLALVAATTVTGRLASVVVATAGAGLRLS
tara:strand:+ start:987 stop:1580 length:594 start_codon:yes stop_codon:yes gene_type:complete